MADTTERLVGVHTLAAVLARGHRLAFGGSCPPGKRSHVWRWKAVVNAVAEGIAAKESLLVPAAPEDAPSANEYLIIFSGSSTIKGRLAE